MVETLILLVVAVALGLYALRELAPRQWAALYRPRRGGAVASRDAAASVAGAVAAGGAVLGREWVTPPAAAMPLLGARSRVLTLWAPLAIVALAFALRVVNLTGVPFGFFCDEASNALDAYWIGHTLHDQHGAFLPVFFQALDDWRGGFHIYWEVPFVAIFGLTEFAVRFGSAVAGTLTVALTYLFVSKAVNRPAGLIAAFLLATSPWHLMWSRVGFEFISLPFVTALCLTCLYYGLERPRLLPFAFIFGAVGIYTYQPGRIFFPLLCATWVVIYARPLWRERRASLVGVVVAAIVFVPTALSILDGTFFARLDQLNGPPQTFAQQFSTFWSNYLAHFGPGFLFQSSTGVILRHYVRGFGMLYGIEAPFLIAGLAVMLWRHNRADLLFLAWFLLYPIATAPVSSPLSSRSIAGVIVCQIIVATGVYAALRGVAWAAGRLGVREARRSLLTGALAGLLLVVGLGATGDFMHAYLVDYPTYASGWWGWQSGPEQIVAYFEAHRASYDRQLMDTEANAPDELLRFYTTPNPSLCASCSLANMADPATVHGNYDPHLRELWAVSPSVLQGSALQSLPHRIVGRLTFPGGATSWLFVATGPEA